MVSEDAKNVQPDSAVLSKYSGPEDLAENILKAVRHRAGDCKLLRKSIH